MSAAAADRDSKRSEGKLKAYQVAASTTIYKGTLVGTNSSGYLVPMSDTSGLGFVGVAFEKVVNSGSNGDKSCRVHTEGEFEFAYAGGDAAQTLVDGTTIVYAQDDQTVDEDAALTTNDYPVGVIVEVVSTTKVRVYISGHLRVSGGVATGDIATSAVTTTKIADNNVTAGKLTATLRTGHIQLNITTPRLLSTNAIQNTTEAGVPDGNTSPSLSRVNGATDKALRLTWAASAVEEIAFAPFSYPADLDDTAAVEVHVLAAMGGSSDTPTLAIGYFEGVGDTNAGGNTGAVTGTSVAEYSVSISASDVGAHPKAACVTLTPAAHGTDALYIYAAWIEYTRK